MAILTGILNSLVILSSIFMVCLILIQRGKGGGLAGAFGGQGGSSAFGTKAGDVFTRVTMITAVVWMLMLMILVVLYNRGGNSAWGGDTVPAKVAKEVPVTPGGGASKSPASPTKEKAGVPSGPAPKETAAPSGVPPVFPDETPAVPKPK